jgi:acyl carrier protein
MATDDLSAQARVTERRIIEFIERELVGSGVAVTRDDDLLSGDLLDSVGVLRLATFVGDELRVDMQPSDFLIENFQTVAVLAAFILRTEGPADDPPEAAGQ